MTHPTGPVTTAPTTAIPPRPEELTAFEVHVDGDVVYLTLTTEDIKGDYFQRRFYLTNFTAWALRETLKSQLGHLPGLRRRSTEEAAS